MDKLMFGGTELYGTVRSTTARVGARQVPALEIEPEGGLTAQELAAMTENDLRICDEAGEVQGVQEGYRTLIRHSVVLAKVTSAEAELAQAQDDLQEARRTNAALEQENARMLYEYLTGEEPTV